MDSLELTPGGWLESRKVSLTEEVEKAADHRWFGLFSLMANCNLEQTVSPDAVADKKTDQAGPQTPHWHPNFRNYERLPDTKVVRTVFFVNGGAVLVALALLVYFGFGELQLSSLRSQTEEWQQRIDQSKAENNLAAANYRKFQAAEAKLTEADKFLGSSPMIANLVADLGNLMPPNVAVDTFDLREGVVMLRCTVRGAPDKASGYASEFVEVLRQAPAFESLFEEVSLTNLNRIEKTGHLAIEVVIQLKESVGGKKKK